MLKLRPPSRQFLPISPPNPPSASYDLGPTPFERNPEPEPSSGASILSKEKGNWIKLPENFFASSPVYVDKYTRSHQLAKLAGRLAFRVRTGEFYRCRLTWGQRGMTAFLDHLSKYDPELSHVDYDKWMDFGKTTDIISRSCITGTIVASCLSTLDSRYRMVPQDSENDKHRSFLEELRRPEIQLLAKDFADLEKALVDYISNAYSSLKKPVKKAREYDQLQDFSIHPAHLPRPQQTLHVDFRGDPLPAEPCQDMVTDCLSQDPTLDSDPVDEQQQPFADQQPQAMQDCSKILMPKYIVGQPHEGSAYPTSGHSQNSVQRYECIAEQPSQQPPQPVISSSSAPYTSSMSSQYCSLGHSMFEPERTQTDQSQPAISTSHGDGYGQVPAHSWSPTVGMPVYGYATSWMDGPPGWTGNQHLPNCHAQVDCYRGVTAAMTPQKPTANIDWLHAHFNHSLFPGVDFSANNQTLLGSNDNILVDSSVAYVGVETSFHQVHGAASSQGLDFSLERGKTSMRAVADMEQRVRC